jgi:hypothetical protein
MKRKGVRDVMHARSDDVRTALTSLIFRRFVHAGGPGAVILVNPCRLDPRSG